MATSTLEGTYKSLLQGVSQQIPRLRLDGQVNTQENMLADPVTSLRRRPAMLFRGSYDFRALNATNLFVQYIERGSDGRNLVINTSTGDWWVMNSDNTTPLTHGTDSYFLASNGASSIQTTSVSGDTFILNVQQSPVAEYSSSKLDPSTTGFFFLKSGVFSKTYDAIIVTNGTSYSTTYTTPTGTADGDVAKATAEYITTQLVTQLQALNIPGITIEQTGVYVYVHGGTNMSVSSNAGTSYIGVSGSHNVDVITNLPARLPSDADGMIMSVGTDSNALVWYRWQSSTTSWVEDSSYGSVSQITNMPRVLGADDQLTYPAFEGRLAGDDNTNTVPTFLDQTVITGITTYQGRLVLLSGAFVSMSKSGNPYRFFRSSVTDLLPADRIDIGIGSSQNSILRRGIQFNRDLVLFGDSIQAVVSGGGTVLTSSNAAISLTSEMSCTSKIAPMLAGQTVLYPFKRSSGYSGLLELIPSQYTSSQYVSQDSTGHLPEYMSGDIRFTSSSNVVNMCLVGSVGAPKDLYIHEYQWSSDGKQQAAWSRWTAPLPIAAAYFAREQLYVVLQDNSICYIVVIDPRDGYDNQTVNEQPYLDLYSSVTVSGGTFSLPSQLRTAYSAGVGVALVYSSGTDITSELGIESIDSNYLVTVVRGVPDGTYNVGLRYTSTFTPTPPILRDTNNKEVGAGHVRLVRMEVAVRNTGAFTTQVEDIRTDVDYTAEVTGVFLNSTELLPEHPLIISQANVLVPCRTMADTTYVSFSTDGTHDMNILDVSYILRYNQRNRRV